MDKTPADLGRLARRPASIPPGGERFIIEDCPNVVERLRILNIVERPSVAILPRNFENAAESSALVRESIASDLRILGAQTGVDVNTFSRVGGHDIHENDALSITAVILLSIEVFNNVGSVAEFLTKLGAYLSRSSRTHGDVEIIQEFIITDYKVSKKVIYRGPSSELNTILPYIQSEMSSMLAPAAESDGDPCSEE